jgi:ABC-type transporter MlaC component
MMKNLLMAVLLGLALATPIATLAAPDEVQKQLVQRTQEAKQKLAAAQAASGAERQKLMQEHMKLMQDIMKQMQTAKPRDSMTPQQMREWIDEHMKLMDQMMGQMMDEYHMMIVKGPGK